MNTTSSPSELPPEPLHYQVGIYQGPSATKRCATASCKRRITKDDKILRPHCGHILHYKCGDFTANTSTPTKCPHTTCKELIETPPVQPKTTTTAEVAGIGAELACGICLETDHHRTFVWLGCDHRVHKDCLYKAFWSDMKRLKIMFSCLEMWANYGCPMCGRYIDGIGLSMILKKDLLEHHAKIRGKEIQRSYQSLFDASEDREDFLAGVRAQVRQFNGASDNTMFTSRASGSRAMEELIHIPLTYSVEEFEFEYLMVCHSDDTVGDLGETWLRQLRGPIAFIDLIRETYVLTRLGKSLPWHRKLSYFGLENGHAIRHDTPRVE
jgi:hypothetical protein